MPRYYEIFLYIGYNDTEHPNPQELSFHEFKNDVDIQSRDVIYFRSKNIFIWDRKNRKDLTFSLPSHPANFDFFFLPLDGFA